MSGAHSILPPSGASAWRRCALWVTMNRLYPQPDTPESLEGNAAHWVAWQMHAGVAVAEGTPAPNGVIVTGEMIEGAQVLIEAAHSRMPLDQYPTHVVEKPVSIGRIHPQCWGTPDMYGVSFDGNVLEVLDYKFGHEFVDEFENDQGVSYIAGIIDEIAANWGVVAGAIDLALWVNFTIVQPRCFYKGAPVRTWGCRASDLRAQINQLSTAAHAALMPEVSATTNEACKNCPGRHACPALQKGAYADAEFAVKAALPVELSPASASLELRTLERALARLQSRVEGLREAVTLYAKSGKVTPFHRLEQKAGRPFWNIDPGEVVAIGQMFNVDLSKPSVVTPTQAKKLGVDEAVIKAYTSTPQGSISLVPENPADARRVFG